MTPTTTNGNKCFLLIPFRINSFTFEIFTDTVLVGPRYIRRYNPNALSITFSN